jgi:hypothetical protein
MAVTLTVEDGTGLTASNSYASVAEFTEYFTNRGDAVAIAAASEDVKAGLVLATQYIEQRFGARFIGTKARTVDNGWDDDQALEWPRYDTPNTVWDFDDDTETGVIPPKLKYACIEYANRARPSLGTPLAPDPVVDSSGVTMVTTKQKAGPVEQEFATAAGTSQVASVSVLRPYPAADMWLNGLLVATAGRTYR